MKRVFKNPILMFTLGLVIAGSIGVLATVVATGITYEPSWTKVNGDPISNVSEALDTLYTKAITPKAATQVATLTTQGATYTMQNDGYITGTIAAEVSLGAGAYVSLNGTMTSRVDYRESSVLNVSIYASKDTVVSTRSDGGTYNLTVYEWK